MIEHLSATGDFDNNWIKRHTSYSFYSNNSALAQGLALSFGVRLLQYVPCDAFLTKQFESLIVRVSDNMLLPVDRGGTCFSNGKEIFFLEFPRKDGNVVLNGWICAIFGLYDYNKFSNDARVASMLDSTIETLEMRLPEYHLPSGWALYDNMGRICSPFYQDLHVALLDAMFRITGSEVFKTYMLSAGKANGRLNRARYTVVKALQKLLLDSERLCVGQGRSLRNPLHK
jgi:hypothetical protein